jgi:aryl-alcohol dehydrogenase-like predicted oxidoreductase
MPIRRLTVPSLGRSLSNLMAAPSSAEPATHEAGQDAYHRMGGNCLHLHGEGGETHSRSATGDWLRTRGLRPEFFLCTQICHDEWDESTNSSIDRFTAGAIREDIAADMELLKTAFVDLVYLDDRPGTPFEPIIDALADEVAAGRIRAWGIRNWTADRIRAARDYTARAGLPFASAVITTELALPVATTPLWPEYIPFDAALERVVRESGLAVFAHAGDLTVGHCLFGDEEANERMRPEWMSRWQTPANMSLAGQVLRIASERNVTPHEINLAWLLNRPFPVIGIVGLPTLLGGQGARYERAAQWIFDDSDLRTLDAQRPKQ